MTAVASALAPLLASPTGSVPRGDAPADRAAPFAATLAAVVRDAPRGSDPRRGADGAGEGSRGRDDGSAMPSDADLSARMTAAALSLGGAGQTPPPAQAAQERQLSSAEADASGDTALASLLPGEAAASTAASTAAGGAAVSGTVAFLDGAAGIATESSTAADPASPAAAGLGDPGALGPPAHGRHEVGLRPAIPQDASAASPSGAIAAGDPGASAAEAAASAPGRTAAPGMASALGPASGRGASAEGASADGASAAHGPQESAAHVADAPTATVPAILAVDGSTSSSGSPIVSASEGTAPATSAPGAAPADTSAPSGAPVGVPLVATAATSPPPVVLAVPTAPEPPRPVAAQVAPAVFALVQRPAGEHRMTLTVHPDSLGPVTVRAHIGQDGGVRVELLGATDAGRDALRAIVADLRRDLAAVLPHATLGLGADGQPAGGRDPGAPGTGQDPSSGSHGDRAPRDAAPAGTPRTASGAAGTVPDPSASRGTGLDIIV
ncbi:flagellar hook-length control protein FliK [uncultured Microbacterium sp.]|uniref:flagellar hook-length control protein FliK n=1 Tax=uncultured Microbacterium sp. TaxID=191216 RepID=UPI0025ECF34B|nr:flagellar hook-length control protein FliK [uncultured Microbacterium sp.]